MTDLYLASQSPRRQALLQQIGVVFEVRVADIDEQVRDTEAPAAYVQRLALSKARSIYDNLAQTARKPVLGADTVVVIDGQILGKPTDRADALAMLSRLAGREHQVMTGVALISGRHSVCVNVSYVTFRELSQAEIEDYWASGEPRDKAGAYAIQGRAASFIRELRGSYSGVMGLPLFETTNLLLEHGVPVWQATTNTD